LANRETVFGQKKDVVLEKAMEVLRWIIPIA
jgi:hypothetical protein